MSRRDYNEEILNNVPDQAPQPAPVTAAELTGQVEVTSKDGLVEVSVDRKTQQLASVIIAELDDIEAVERSIVEAVNAGLDKAESGASGPDFEQAVEQRMAEFDKAMDALSAKMDDLDTQLSKAMNGLIP